MACGLSCSVGCGILVLWPGIELASPALESGFLTTGPPGKSLIKLFLIPGGAVIKNSPANVGDRGLIPGLGRSLEKEMATYSSIIAWKILWTEEHGGLQSMGWK